MVDRPIRVAMLTPPWYEVPPAGYGGIEQLIADLVAKLVEHGHDVTLIGVGEQGTAAKHVRTYPTPQSERLGQALPEVVHAAMATRLLAGLDVDIVHDHTTGGPLTATARAVPTVATVHGPVDGEFGDLYAAIGDSVSLVAISDSQRSLRPDLNWVATVYNAIDVADFPYQESK